MIEIEDVFVASIAPVFATSSSFLKISNLTDLFSVAASINRSQFLSSFISLTVDIAFIVFSTKAKSHFAFSTPFLSVDSIKSTPFFNPSGETSKICTV